MNKTYRYAPMLLTGALTGLTVLSGALLSAPSVSADSSGTVTLTVDVPAACSLVVNPSSHTVTINPGNTGLIGTSTIKSICNDPAGLAVYAVGYTGDTYGNTNLASTVGSNTINIATNVTPSGTPESSEWYMTLAAVSGDYTPTIATGYDSAHIIPNVYTKVAYRNTMTDIGTNATGANFTASFNAYIAPTQAAGTYTGKVKFLLVHPNVLTYNDQTGEPATTQPATLPRDPEAPIGGCPANSPILQNVASWGSSMALGETVDAIDSRDNQCYKVKRLKMNAAGTQTALWMSNLNLGAETLTVTQLDDTNTHLASDIPAISSTTFNSWVKSSGTNSTTGPELIPIKSSNTCEFYDAQLDDYVSSSCPEQDSYGNKYGVLYNFAAASAGYVDGFGTGNATSDLCPAGWRMPTGGDTGELQTLIDAYELNDVNYEYADANSFTSMQQDLGFSLAGGFSNGLPNNQGSSGSYQSSTFYLGKLARVYPLDFNGGHLYPALSAPFGYGYSVRCIAQ